MGREAWIWVGPPFPIHDGTQTSKTRVMTYRQGTHIDCDEAVGPAEPFSRALAHAVQGMVLWLAEKPARMERINRICIGQVGGSAYRVLWTPGPERRLDAQDMLRRAYGGNAMNLPKSYSPQADTDAYIQALELEKRRSRARSLIGFEGWDREEEAEPAAPTSGGAAEDFKVKMGAPVPVKPRATGVKTTLKAASDEDEDGWNVDDVFGE